MSFPSLVGGTVTKEDLVPSVIFAVLYGCLVLLAAFRLIRKSSRTTLLINPTLFAVERIVVFSLRVTQAKSESRTKSTGLTSYEQLTIGMGYISIANSLVLFLRVLLVNTTLVDLSDESLTRRRAQYRRMCGILNLAFLSAIIPGTIAGTHYSQSINSPATARSVMGLRYAATSITFVLTAIIGTVSFVASRKIQGIRKSAASVIMLICCLLSLVSIYRFVVMHNTVDSLVSRGPGSLSSPAAKSWFYILHMAPEWLSVFILLSLNSREIFDSGPFGDWRWKDPKKETEKVEGFLIST